MALDSNLRSNSSGLSSSRSPRSSAMRRSIQSKKREQAAQTRLSRSSSKPDDRARLQGRTSAPSIQPRASQRKPQSGKPRRSASLFKNTPLPLMFGIIGLIVIGLIVGVVLHLSPVFAIQQVEANRCDHISPEALGTLADIHDGMTLLTVDSKKIEKRLETNPWIEKAEVVKEFPHTLKIYVTESAPVALVELKGDQGLWYVTRDGRWLAPAGLKEGQTSKDLAQQEGRALITEIEAVQGLTAGSPITDEGVTGAIQYLTGFSDYLSGQIVRIAAPSKESITLALKSGVEISVGAPSQLTLKEQVISALLDQHRDEVTYINVRVPEQPAWRGLEGR